MKRRSFLFALAVFGLLAFMPAIDGGDKFGWWPVWVAYSAFFRCLAAWNFWDVVGVSALIIFLHVGCSAALGIFLAKLERSAAAQGAATVSGEYWRAAQGSLCFQLFLGFGALLVSDFGILMQLWAISMAAFWMGAALIVARRPARPTKTDLFLLRWSFPFLMILVASPLVLCIWRARGLMD
ncbi:MAG: hypothetical protein AB7V22_00985 [Kiritimatiellia bacterium]